MPERGECPVCAGEYALTDAGRLYQHGHAAAEYPSDDPCLGSGSRPVDNEERGAEGGGDDA